jgi:hypothetical protein
MKTEIRQYAFVRFIYETLPKEYHSGYPFKAECRYIFMGEIPNMLGHCIVMDDNGKHYVGFHTDNFIELDIKYHGDSRECDLDHYGPVAQKR